MLCCEAAIVLSKLLFAYSCWRVVAAPG